MQSIECMNTTAPRVTIIIFKIGRLCTSLHPSDAIVAPYFAAITGLTACLVDVHAQGIGTGWRAVEFSSSFYTGKNSKVEEDVVGEMSRPP